MTLIKKEEQEKTNDSKDIENKINELKRRQEDLLDMKLGNKITEELYLLKNNKLEEDIFELKSRKNTIWNEDYKQKIEILLELAGSFYRSYLNLNEEWKSQIVKYLMLELKVNTKKELQVKESPLFESSKMLNFLYGGAKRNWTAVQGVADLCMTTLPWHQKNTINASDYMKNF